MIYKDSMQNAQIHLQQGPADYTAPRASDISVRAITSTTSFPPVPSQIKSILIIKLDALGDHILHTPFFAALRKFYPQARISLLCVKATSELALHNPAFDHIIVQPFPAGADQRQAALFGMQLQSHEAAPFDLILVPRWSEDWHHAGVIAQLIDAPCRVSFSAHSTPFKLQHALQHENFYTHVIDAPGNYHEVWRSMQMLQALGMELPRAADIRQELHPSPEDETQVKDLLQNKDYPRPWFVLGVGASAEHKRWPGEKFAELAAALQKDYGGTCFIIGHGDADSAAATAILSKRKDCVNLVGNLSPRASGIFIGECDMIITNDSFALHAAATMGTPVVEIVGHPADGSKDTEFLPFRFGPWGVRFAWVQPASCAASEYAMQDYLDEVKCIGDVPVRSVLTAIQELHHGKITS